MTLPIDEKRNALNKFGMFEAKIALKRFTVNRHEAARELSTSLAVDQLIPCILHMK
jgi:hypothetical protein